MDGRRARATAPRAGRAFKIAALVWGVCCAWIVVTNAMVCPYGPCFLASGPGRIFEFFLVAAYGALLWIAGLTTFVLIASGWAWFEGRRTTLTGR